MSKVKFFSAKKVLSAALALVMTASAMPMVFAAEDEAPLAPTGPVKQEMWTDDCPFPETWNGSKGRWADKGLGGTGGYVSFRMENQQFTFVQTEPNQHFRFETELGAAVNTSGINYGYVYKTSEIADQGQLVTPIGSECHVSWSEDIAEIPSTNWKDVTLTVDFVGNGAADYIYNPETKTGPAFHVWYDSKAVWGIGESHRYEVNIPFRVTVIDKVALVSAIEEADKLEEANYPVSAWRAFRVAYDAAVAVLENDAATQAEVNTALTNLLDAIENLDGSQVNVNIRALSDAVKAAQAKIDEGKAGDWYLDDAVNALNALIEEGNNLVENATANDMERVKALTAEIIAKTADLDNQLKPADFSGLDKVIEQAEEYLNDPSFEKKYDESGVEAVKTAYKRAKETAADREGKTRKNDQGTIDMMKNALNSALQDLPNHRLNTVISKAWIVATNSSDELSGEVIYHKTPWYKTWTSQTVELTVKTDNDAAFGSIEWVPANWSVDDPEAKIEGVDSQFDKTAVVRPTFGIGPRSFWIKAIITDVEGTKTETAPIKVRFINYDWQK